MPTKKAILVYNKSKDFPFLGRSHLRPPWRSSFYYNLYNFPLRCFPFEAISKGGRRAQCVKKSPLVVSESCSGERGQLSQQGLTSERFFVVKAQPLTAMTFGTPHKGWMDATSIHPTGWRRRCPWNSRNIFAW